MVKLADRITNLQPPPKHWDIGKIGRYLKSAELIFHELSDACPVLCARMSEKLGGYRKYTVG